jgi:integrase
VLLAAAPEWRLLVRLLADTGLRVGEAIALKRGDLDLGRRRLRVRQRFYKGDFAPEEPLRAPRRASLPRSRP